MTISGSVLNKASRITREILIQNTHVLKIDCTWVIPQNIYGYEKVLCFFPFQLAMVCVTQSNICSSICGFSHILKSLHHIKYNYHSKTLVNLNGINKMYHTRYIKLQSLKMATGRFFVTTYIIVL